MSSRTRSRYTRAVCSGRTDRAVGEFLPPWAWQPVSLARLGSRAVRASQRSAGWRLRADAHRVRSCRGVGVVGIAGGDQPSFVGERDEAGAVAAVELAQDVAHVGFGGV